MEIAPGIHRIDAPLGERVCSMSLLLGQGSAVLIDTGIAGMVGDYVVPYLTTSAIDPARIRLILITHADIDHSGDMAGAREAFPNALIASHRDDADEIASVETLIDRRYGQFSADHGIVDPPEATAWVRNSGRCLPVDLQLTGGERVRLDADWEVEIIHTPGHSRGHLAIWDARSRTAVIADAALWRNLPTTAGEPAFPPTYRYVDAYLGTIARIESLGAETLLTSHYPTMRGAAAVAFLAESRAYAEQVETVIRDVLNGAGAMSMREVIVRAAPRLGSWPAEAMIGQFAFPIAGHLERLEALGAVMPGRNQDGLATWQTVR